MEHNVDDHCEYWDDGCCCNTTNENCGQVTTEICASCSDHKTSIKNQSIKLLHELSRLASNNGYHLEQLVDNSQHDIIESMNDLAEKLNEVELFLEAVGVISNKETN
jgi:disulfide oxidoreductase YuzD